MYHKIRNYLVFLLAILLHQTVFSQKEFHVIIQFPPHTETKNVLIEYDNGKQVVKVANSFKNNKIAISGKFYSKYATIKINYPKSKSSFHYNEFFISDQSASIRFVKQNDPLKSPLENFVLDNAWEVSATTGAKMLKAYTLNEFTDFMAYVEKFGDGINTNESILNTFNKKYNRLLFKQFEYVRQNGDDYYSFWFFRTNLLGSLKDTVPAILLETFNSTFLPDFKKSVEGKEVQKFLYGILYTKKNYAAPGFQSKDITGKPVSLKNYRGRYVLLDFWATWCGPCMDKVPLVNKLRKNYSKEKLAIIGITSDSDSAIFIKTIKDHQMNWIHIFGDSYLRQIYGDKPIPQLYLIDRTGKIIYFNWEDGYDHLEELLKKLLG